MTFDLSDFSITTIGYREPTLWAAIAIASVVAILVGYVLGRTVGRVRDRWRRRVYGISASGALFASLVLLTVMILDGLFGRYHRGMVWHRLCDPSTVHPSAGCLGRRTCRVEACWRGSSRISGPSNNALKLTAASRGAAA